MRQQSRPLLPTPRRMTAAFKGLFIVPYVAKSLCGASVEV
jgi:hypothetical protein